MLVFWKQRLVYLATPQTASTAIEAALSPLATLTVGQPKVMKHTPLATYHRYIGPYLAELAGDGFATVALMREPQDWLASWFRARHRDEEDEDHSTGQVSFDQFLRGWCSEEPPHFARVGRQTGFLAPEPGLRVDHIFRYETLKAFTDFLEDRLDFAIHLPRLNVSPLSDTRVAPETADLLRQFGRAEFELYESL